MYRPSTRLQRFQNNLRKVPGVKTFGSYVFLPIFFVAGAALEFTMIHWHVGPTNFYTVYKRTQSKQRAQELFQEYLSNKEKPSSGS